MLMSDNLTGVAYLNKQGGCCTSFHLIIDAASLHMNNTLVHRADTKVYPRQEECHIRSAPSPGSSDGDRMVLSSSSVARSVENGTGPLSC